MTYNSSGYLTKETELEGGVEISRAEYICDELGRIIESNLFIGGELYETNIATFNENGFETITIREGVEVERFEKTENGDEYTNKFYENGVLVECQICESDAFENLNIIRFYDLNNELTGKKVEIFNNSNELLKSEEYNATNILLSESQYEVQNGLLLSELHRDFFNGLNEFEIIYEYDENENLVKNEKHNLSGQILEFHFYKYDENNRLIEENGLSKKNYDYPGHLNGDEFHFVHKYEQ